MYADPFNPTHLKQITDIPSEYIQYPAMRPLLLGKTEVESDELRIALNEKEKKELEESISAEKEEKKKQRDVLAERKNQQDAAHLLEMNSYSNLDEGDEFGELIPDRTMTDSLFWFILTHGCIIYYCLPPSFFSPLTLPSFLHLFFLSLPLPLPLPLHPFFPLSPLSPSLLQLMLSNPPILSSIVPTFLPSTPPTKSSYALDFSANLNSVPQDTSSMQTASTEKD